MPLEAKSRIVLEGVENEPEFCKTVMQWRQDGLNHDDKNRDRGVEDTRYAAGYQWPLDDFKWRRDNNIPAMTFNIAFTLLKQRLNARARKRVGPKVAPFSPGEKYTGIAQIREGLIRNIEMNSDIASIDAIVSQNQLIAGIAHYELSIDYANADVFETDISISTDYNPWNVIWDNQSREPTGKDARWVIREQTMSRADFKKKFPKAKAIDIGENPAQDTSYPITMRAGPLGSLGDWISEDEIRIALVWYMQTRKKNIALLTNGDVVEIGDTPPEEFVMPDGAGGFHTVVMNPQTEMYMVRESEARYAVGILTNGVEYLAEPYELEIDRVPIIRVPGWQIQAGDRVERFGMISFAKDAMSFYNYVKSDRIERIVYRNRAQYEAQEDALSREQEAAYKNAHKLRGGVLKYRGPKPEQVQPPVVDQAAILETQAAQQSIFELFDSKPNVSEGTTPASGLALEQQMNVADTGGIIYDDLLRAAKKEMYRVINQLIPISYDTPRIVKIVGEDNKMKDTILNDPDNPESADITIGKYSVDVSTGPSLETQRVQAIEFYQTMFNANPELMGLVAPELIELLNIPGTDKLVKALRERTGMADEEMTPEQMQEAQQQQQMQQQMQQMEMRMAELELAKREAEVQSKLASAEQSMATAESERAQSQERISKIAANEATASIKMAETEQRINLLASQIEKVYAEIAKINSSPPTAS